MGLSDRGLRPLVARPWYLEEHTAAEHPGWTATYQLLQSYPNQRQRVVPPQYAADELTYRSAGGGSSPSIVSSSWS